jgi:putative transcriptional regulator
VARPGATERPGTLTDLRRAGAVTSLLFLYECTTGERPGLQPIADRLELTVQAASHVYRQLRRAGLVERRRGVYRPTVAGVAWLHGALGTLRDDLARRMAALRVMRSARALALAPVRAGEPVSLEMRDGWLAARPGTGGASTGRAVRDGRRGSLIEVSELEGIVPIPPGRIRVVAIPESEVAEPGTPAKLRAAVGEASRGHLAAVGLEAWQLLGQAGVSPTGRFGVGAGALEAAQLGVDSTVVLLETDLPRFLDTFREVVPPNLVVERLGRPPRSTGRSTRAPPEAPRARRRSR